MGEAFWRKVKIKVICAAVVVINVVVVVVVVGGRPLRNNRSRRHALTVRGRTRHRPTRLAVPPADLQDIILALADSGGESAELTALVTVLPQGDARRRPLAALCGPGCDLSAHNKERAFLRKKNENERGITKRKFVAAHAPLAVPARYLH